MTSKKLLLLCFVCFSLVAKSQTKNPFFYELISNDSKTINFVFGFYPSSYAYMESKDVTAYTEVKAAVINNSDVALPWTDYKVCILLTNGTLIRSYTTAAADGDYDCNYTAAPKETHYQYFCFHSKFTNAEIDKVWLIMSDDQIFNLIYDKNQ